MSALYNATCRIIEPVQTASGTDDLEREHSTQMHGERRCSLRQMTLHQEATVLGGAALGAWRCRLHSPVAIQPGWRIEARLDGQAAWMNFVVRRVAATLHTDLMLERA